MECATPVQLFNFLIATTGTVIIDCRPEDLYSKNRLTYPLLIHLSLEKLETLENLVEKGSPEKLCSHHSVSCPPVPISEEVVVRALQGIELLAGPYERCVLRNRSKSRVVLISEHAKLPAAIAQFSFLLLQEEKCLGVYHTAFEFNDFCDMYPFTFETKSRRTSNCSDSMRPSLSLELDDMSIMKQKKALITQYPNAILGNNLYLGTRAQALNLPMMATLKITHIIRAHDIRENRCREDLQNFEVYRRATNIKYLDVSVDDKLGTEIGMFLKPCIAFYDEAMEINKENRVFVHCNMGISRSSTIVISILMTNERMSLKSALNFAQECRHVVQPNYSFMKELIKYEVSVLGSNSIKMSELTKLNAHYSRAYAMDVQEKTCNLL